MPLPGAGKSTRVKACSECRQQKLRCDAFKDYSQSCSRCSRLNLECVVQKSFQRTKKQTKAELREEVDRLRQGIQTGEQNVIFNASCPSIVSLRVTPTMDSPEPAVSHHGSYSGNQQASGTSHSITSTPPRAEFPISSNLPNLSNGFGPGSSILSTSPQRLEDLDFNAKQIDDCFHLFMRNCAPQVSIFEPRPTPNECYSQSPLLFWTIVAIGSRKYPDDPTMLSLLAPRLLDMVRKAVFSRKLPTMQAFLLLCVWPMPVDTLDNDISTILIGVILQLAMNIGLHLHGDGQDFSRTTLNPDSDEVILRSKLWMSCLITTSRINCANGLPPVSVLDGHNCRNIPEDTLAGIPQDLLYQLRLAQILTDSTTELGKCALAVKNTAEARVLQSMIDIFSSHLTEIESDCPEQLSHFHLLCVRLQIQSFHFFVPQPDTSYVAFLKLYTLACTVVEAAAKLDSEQGFSAPAYMGKMLHLAACVILRLSRSSLGQSLDSSRGQRAYFSTIEFHRKVSIQHNDVASRSTVILTQLWTSQNIFMQPDGSVDSFKFLCRKRLAMSIVFDLFWRWRNEFAGQPHPYQGKSCRAGAAKGYGTPPHDILPDIEQPSYIEYLEPSQAMYPDFDWSAMLEIPVNTWNTLHAALDDQCLQFGDTTASSAQQY